jgi:hypothetical protein
MSDFEDRIPPELEPTAARLREQRVEADPVTLDQIKLRALASSTSRQGQPSSMKSRLATIVTIVGLMAGTSGAVALGWQGGGGNGDGHGAAYGQYHDGKGCGRNHKHFGSEVCKGPHGGLHRRVHNHRPVHHHRPDHHRVREQGKRH